MVRLFLQFAKNEAGATAIEYSLIAFGIGVAIVVAVISLGSDLNTSYTNIDNALQ